MSTSKKITILLAEDHAIVRQGLTALLDVDGHFQMVGEARTGREAVELAQTLRPDVILMDINLPGISGITALSILGDDTITASIPVIALSANAMPRDIEKGLEAGFFRYLTKPIKVHEFMAALDAALDAAKAASTRRINNGRKLDD